MSVTAIVGALLAAAAPIGAAPPPGEPPASSRELVLTPGQMFRLAEIAEGKGDVQTALAIYAALERNRDPDIRAEARFRHAKQLLAQKRVREAALLLRRLLDERPGAVVARLELAHALELLDDPDAALRELRAAQAGGLPPAVARLVDRYSQALRASRPVGGSLEVALAPDSNINRGTRSDSLGTIFGDFDIDRSSKAKSGIGLALRGQAYRRFTLGRAKDSVLVRVSGLADVYRRSRFNDIALDIAAGPELRLGRNQVNLELGATQRWFGQKPFLRSARVAATWVRPLGTRTQLRTSASAALVDNRFNDLQDGKAFSGRLEVEHALDASTGIGVNAAINRESDKEPGYSTTGWRAGLLGWRQAGRMTFTAEAEFGKLRADQRLVLFPDKRSDRYSRLSLGATFRQLEFKGFAPIVRFTVERNKSTIAFYDFRRTRTEVGVARAF